MSFSEAHFLLPNSPITTNPEVCACAHMNAPVYHMHGLTQRFHPWFWNGDFKSEILFFFFVLCLLFYHNENVKLQQLIESDLLISLPVSLCSCLLLLSPCLRITDVLVVCVCGMNRGTRVAGLSCKFSQRLKQRRDDVTAFRIAVAFAAEF